MRQTLVRCILVSALVLGVNGGCPHASMHTAADSELNAPHRALLADAAAGVNFADVKQDLVALFTDSKGFWPADYGNYGPLFVRMAWHCSGSYRQSDGRGGCDGGRQRFNPELSWPDNTNLDKAHTLLQPIKLKYGAGLSWGDLFILAGDTAIESMGGPILGFCGGRIDDPDGTSSLELGPSIEQEMLAPCPVNGNCSAPLGQAVIGLIYVDPEGPMGKPHPEGSVSQIRDVFGRMGMNDSETVALIGGGHAFGKTHGACPDGPGPSPQEDPLNPYPGTCGTGPDKGKGKNTFTSGFEGAWTDEPTKWDNDYFHNLLDYDWEVHVGPGGHHQWRPVQKPGGPAVVEDIMMLTTDVALIKDPGYLELVKKFADDPQALDVAFSNAWYKLVSRDMGPVTRCLGNFIPPAQPFQYPLPPTPKRLANFDRVRADIKIALTSLAGAKYAPLSDVVDAEPYYGALFATLAWQCASTFRATDFLGGCNGARIRFSPQKDWPVNDGMDEVLGVLSSIKTKYDKPGSALSWADLIVLAGQTAIEEAGGKKMKFCGGRTDASDGSGSESLAPRRFKDPLLEVRDNAKVMGLTSREAVVLSARPRSVLQQQRLGYDGSWTTDPSTLSNAYFTTLLTETWKVHDSDFGLAQYKAVGKHLYMLPTDLALKGDAEYLAIAQEYASDNRAFLNDFAAAWTKVVNADRFLGPGKNVCTTCSTPECPAHLEADGYRSGGASTASE